MFTFRLRLLRRSKWRLVLLWWRWLELHTSTKHRMQSSVFRRWKSDLWGSVATQRLFTTLTVFERDNNWTWYRKIDHSRSTNDHGSDYQSSNIICGDDVPKWVANMLHISYKVYSVLSQPRIQTCNAEGVRPSEYECDVDNRCHENAMCILDNDFNENCICTSGRVRWFGMLQPWRNI